jgi:hypothetical protein
MMLKKPMPKLLEKDSRKARTEWLAAIDQIVKDITEWSQQEAWLVHQTQKPLKEPGIGEYKAPVLQIKTPADHIIVEPVARYIVNADGRIDVYAWPTLRRAALVRRDGRWTLRYDEDIRRIPWSRRNFVQVAQTLTAP